MSCSIFSPKVIPKDKVLLTEESFDKLDGSYKIFPNLEIRENTKFKPVKENAYSNLHSYIGERTIIFDSLSDYLVDIKVVSKNSLSFTFKSDKIDLEKILISGELKKDGLFYLHNSIKECKGIPLIFGRCNIRKARIGQTENNDLLFNVARDNSGTFLVVFSTGIRSNSAFIYEKIE